MPLLIYATATHPSCAMRLWSLKAAAPSGDMPEMAVCAQTVRRHRIATKMAFVGLAADSRGNSGGSRRLCQTCRF